MSRELMQQALEAIEGLTTYDSRPSSIWRYFYPSATGDYVNLREFKELVEPFATALRAALAEPEQEPVAWISESENLLSWDKFYDHMKPLYTAPTPRKPEQPYDQTALDLCTVCGWRTLIPGDACLNCERSKPPEQKPVAWMYDFLNPNNREEVIRNWVTQNPDDIEREKGFNVRPLYPAPTPNTLEESNGKD